MQKPDPTLAQRLWLAALAAALLGAAALLPGCTAQLAPDPDFRVAALFATPGRALATVELTATPTPTETPTGLPPGLTPGPTLPLPTVVPLPQPTLAFSAPGPTPTRSLPAVLPVLPGAVPTAGADCAPPAPPFAAAYQASPEGAALLGCPTGAVQSLQTVYQAFEHGVMFWRERDRSIFVVSTRGLEQGQPSDSWWRLDDTFQDGEPESDPAFSPPEGLLQPVRGFGKVWRDNAFVRDALGWATGVEYPAESQWLDFEGGWMLTGPGGSPVYLMIPSDAPPHTTGVHYSPR